MSLTGNGVILHNSDTRRREQGLVYIDPGLTDIAATHTLIIGVGDFPDTDEMQTLSSTTASARAVADWFLGPLAQSSARPAFRNSYRPLGSLAVVLSERDIPRPACSTYAGGSVPRATFENASQAVWEWVVRLNSHEENLAVLLVCSHGKSNGPRTAFILEDYGSKVRNRTFGMSEVEQLVSALQVARPLDQLLIFDCCRTEADGDLPWDIGYGEKFIQPRPLQNDHGKTRQQFILRSTALGAVALGRPGKTSIFIDGLLRSLNGVGSDPTTTDWPVRPSTLYSGLERMLILHRLPNEELQLAESKIVRNFAIHYPRKTADVPVFVSFNDPSEWPRSRISMLAGNDWRKRLTGKEQPLFAEVRIPRGASLTASSRRDGRQNGEAQADIYPPAFFLALDEPALPAQNLKPMGQHRGTSGRDGSPVAAFAVSVVGSGSVKSGAIVTVSALDIEGWQTSISVDILRKQGAEQPPRIKVPFHGAFRIEVRTPVGVTLTRIERIEPREVKHLVFEIPPTSHDRLNERPRESGTAQSWRRDAPISVETVTLDVSVGNRAGYISAPMRIGLGIEISPPQHERIRRVSLTDLREVVWNDGIQAPPRMVFLALETNGRREAAAVPSLGEAALMQAKPWFPHVVINLAAPRDAFFSSVTIGQNDVLGIDASDWSGLLGFLAVRDFESAGLILGSGHGQLGDTAVDSVRMKGTNPFAAVAGALVLVAMGGDAPLRLRSRASGDWLRNLADWFPSIADGPIVFGWRVLSTARNREGRMAALPYFLEGLARGVPAYSLSVEYLARGLERLAVENAALGEQAKAARALANRVDPRQAFTVVRLD
ncbi:caspase family protein [Mesorhizobium sp. ES1-6]|uniref:caspase family protein n=1 Tax=Mesorhizobium sp. ES1-6 TaxID=2876626 RepID=UPI001CCC26AA|nr:caspase family protein [Mesorhizobium sp. ES1-6]MBZ9801094.1 caspase family protein [Mesorhizobium sp. ES1-6]